MSLDYDQNIQSFAAVAEILDDYVEWFAQIASAVAYPLEAGNADSIQKPNGFNVWMERSRDEVTFLPDVLDNLEEIHIDLISASEILIQVAASGNQPDFEDFNDFKNMFEAFAGRLRRLEKDSLSDGAGLDETTGFRDKNVVFDDLKKELERVSRHSNPFSVIYARIDKFSHYDDQEHVIDLVVNNIKKCMRTFDDSYYLEDGNFVLSLKQADMIGAQSVTTRIQQYILTNENNIKGITLSYCMSELVPGDSVETLIANMKADLDSYDDEEDVVLKFVEVSPLQRYMDDIKK